MKRFILACMVLFMSVSAVFAQSDLQVLAVIKMNKNESITVKQLKARVNTYQKQIGKALTVDEKKMVLDALIEERLILQAAGELRKGLFRLVFRKYHEISYQLHGFLRCR